MAPKAQLKRPASAAMKRPAAAKASAKSSGSSMKKPAAVRKAKTLTKLQVVAEEQPTKMRRKTVTDARDSGSTQIALEGLRAFLLGLERRPDRRERCERMLTEHVPWLEVEFFRATDGKSDVVPDAEVSKTWNTSCNSLYGAYEDVVDKDGNVLHTAAEFADPGVDYEFSPGERGCAHSHRRMWERVAEMDGPMLVLEDDVQLDFERTDGSRMNGEIFKERLALGIQEAAKKDADVLYLGWSGFRDGNYKYLKAPRSKKSFVVRRAEYVWTTVAYVLWPAGAKKLLLRAQPMNQPVDNFMGWESREERLSSWVLLDTGDSDDTWAGGIVTQLDFNGDSDIKKSDGGDQGDDPTKYLAKKPELEDAPQDVKDESISKAMEETAPAESSQCEGGPTHCGQEENGPEEDASENGEDAPSKDSADKDGPEEEIATECAAMKDATEDARDDP